MTLARIARRPLTQLALLMTSAIVLAACSTGPEAPIVGAIAEVCTPDFCVDYPNDWSVVDTGEQFVSFAHPEGADLIATVGRVNLEGIADNAGATWPVPPREVVDLLWSLLDGGEAELGAAMLVPGGSLDSWGFISSGRLWHRLIPVSASRGFGIEVRAPNASWETHADVFRQGLTVLNDDL